MSASFLQRASDAGHHLSWAETSEKRYSGVESAGNDQRLPCPHGIPTDLRYFRGAHGTALKQLGLGHTSPFQELGAGGTWAQAADLHAEVLCLIVDGF